MSACPAEAFDHLLTLFGTGRLEEALERSRELVSTCSGDARLWNLRAAILARAGDEAGALAAWERSLEIDPENPKALNNRAVFHLGRQRHDAAIADITRALEAAPGDPQLLNSLAAAQVQKGDLKAAEKSLRASLTAKSDSAEVLSNLGVVLAGLGRQKEAIPCLDRALEIDPAHMRAREQLGMSLVSAGRYEEAVQILKTLADDSIASPEAILKLAVAYEALGNMESARGAAERAISSAPRMTAAYFVLARLKKFTPDDPAVAAMRALANDPGLSSGDRSHICFALGRALQDIEGQEEAAFAAIAEGNRLRRAEFDFSIDRQREVFERLKSRPLFPEGAEGRRPTPLFILGMPRSGTTLVEQILASHPEVYGAGELHALSEAVSETGWLDDAMVTPNPAMVARAYRERLPKGSSGARFVTDKMPLNFRWIGFIAEAFPEAPIVHLRRHPMAVCWSILSLMFRDRSTLFGYDQEELGAYYRLYDDLMNHWDSILPGRIYHLSYEALTEDQEGETRRLLSHLGLGFEPACLEFHKTVRPVATASATQVRRKLYKGSSDAWRRFETHLGPLQCALGHVLDDWN